jgi:hypothetical protein
MPTTYTVTAIIIITIITIIAIAGVLYSKYEYVRQ